MCSSVDSLEPTVPSRSAGAGTASGGAAKCSLRNECEHVAVGRRGLDSDARIPSFQRRDLAWKGPCNAMAERDPAPWPGARPRGGSRCPCVPADVEPVEHLRSVPFRTHALPDLSRPAGPRRTPSGRSTAADRRFTTREPTAPMPIRPADGDLGPAAGLHGWPVFIELGVVLPVLLVTASVVLLRGLMHKRGVRLLPTTRPPLAIRRVRTADRGEDDTQGPTAGR